MPNNFGQSFYQIFWKLSKSTYTSAVCENLVKDKFTYKTNGHAATPPACFNKKWTQPQKLRNIKNKDNLENGDDIKNEDDLKNEDNLKNQDDLKN